MRFRRVKDAAAPIVHGGLTLAARAPDGTADAVFRLAGAVAKLLYFLPGGHPRRTAMRFARVRGHDDARRVYFQTIDKLVRVLGLCRGLMRHDGDYIGRQFRLEDDARGVVERARREDGAAILVVPHCVGSVMGMAGFCRTVPSLVLLRESRDPGRAAVIRRYLDRLGVDTCDVRRTDATTVAYHILHALQAGKVVVGTTDVIRRKPDTVPVRMFGQQVWVPNWPARFSARRGVPIVPAYVRLDEHGLTMQAGPSFVAGRDLSAASQQWADYFEACFRAYPADWVFQFDKRWAGVLAAAARQG